MHAQKGGDPNAEEYGQYEQRDQQLTFEQQKAELKRRMLAQPAKR